MAAPKKKALGSMPKMVNTNNTKKMTVRMDDMMDRKAGIKENSPKDITLDKQRGVK